MAERLDELSMLIKHSCLHFLRLVDNPMALHLMRVYSCVFSSATNITSRFYKQASQNDSCFEIYSNFVVIGS